MAPRPTWELTAGQRELVRGHQTLVSILAYSFTSDAGLIADLVSVGNESLCVAAYKWDPTRGSQFRSYANTVVRNDMLDFLRQRGARQGRESSIDSLVGVETSDGIELPFVDLQLAMASLPGELRNIVVESVCEGRSMAEIGRRRGRSNVWAWLRYHEGLKMLRQIALEKGWGAEAPMEGDHL